MVLSPRAPAPGHTPRTPLTCCAPLLRTPPAPRRRRSTHLGLVMEYVAGGNMADYILKTILLKFGSFDTRDGLVMEEDEARYFFTQIISAVEYCHNNKVAHRCARAARAGAGPSCQLPAASSRQTARAARLSCCCRTALLLSCPISRARPACPFSGT